MKFKFAITGILFLLLCMVSYGQSSTTANKNKYKMVLQLVSGDTAVQHGAVMQIYNALAEAPNSTIEVVCHSAGISFLQISKTIMANDIEALKKRGVVFAACANTIRMRKIDKADIVPQAIIVPAGIIELVDKQTKGWAYLRMGN